MLLVFASGDKNTIKIILIMALLNPLYFAFPILEITFHYF